MHDSSRNLQDLNCHPLKKIRVYIYSAEGLSWSEAYTAGAKCETITSQLIDLLSR